MINRIIRVILDNFVILFCNPSVRIREHDGMIKRITQKG